ncbi:MAG: L,D-transpeptidase family protein [Propionivibrio sp.]|nr:L,D-transpeptidase family protein [Propionivibrio sp.]
MRRASLLVVLALILTAPFFLTDAFVQAGPGKPAPPPTFSDSGPEPQLSRILVEIENNQLDKALQLTENLLQQYPKFRLAHLIKGDLLLARSMPLATFGNATNAPSDKLDDLREEVIARLKAYRSRDTIAKYVPRYLLQMQPDQKHAIVIDTQKARLYLYQNDNGRPRFVADYYVSHGKLGSDKRSEGDKKTPTGVYHVTDSLPAKKLGDLYGTGAFPINYPNEWDRRQGRKGHGIWLHGTPSDTFSRPPKASDGCVVLSNTDLDALSKNLQIGLTPVIISNSVEWLSFDDWQSERSALNKKIEEWRADWESRDVERYLKHYSPKFQSKEANFEQFASQKRKVNAGKSWVKVKLSNLSMFRNPGAEELVVTTFEQDYQSNNLNNQMKKRQYWIREDGQWKIVYEGVA